MGTPTNRIVTLRYAVDEPPASWTLEDEPVPQSNPHDLTADLLYQLLRAWVSRTGRDALVGREIAVRWDEHHEVVDDRGRSLARGNRSLARRGRRSADTHRRARRSAAPARRLIVGANATTIVLK